MAETGKEILETQRDQVQQGIDNMRQRRSEVLETLEQNATQRGAPEPKEAALNDYYTILAQQRFHLQALKDAISRS